MYTCQHEPKSVWVSSLWNSLLSSQKNSRYSSWCPSASRSVWKIDFDPSSTQSIYYSISIFNLKPNCIPVSSSSKHVNPMAFPLRKMIRAPSGDSARSRAIQLCSTAAGSKSQASRPGADPGDVKGRWKWSECNSWENMASDFCSWLRLIRFSEGYRYILSGCIILLLVVLRYSTRNQIFQHVPGKSPIGQIIIHSLSLKSTSDKIYADSDWIINFVLCQRKTIWLQQFPIYHHLSPPITIYHLRNPPEFRCFFFHRQVSRTLQVVLGSAVTAVLAARRSKVPQVSRGMGIWAFSFLEKREVLSIVVWMDVWIVWIFDFEDMCYIL